MPRSALGWVAGSTVPYRLGAHPHDGSRKGHDEGSLSLDNVG